MPTPRKGYFLADGTTKVPGVTTILGRFKDSGALIHWAWRMGKEGQDYAELRDKAANAGTLAHALIEADINKSSFDVSQCDGPTLTKAQSAFTAYQNWARGQNIEYLWTERPLVSERHRFGGTPDALGVMNGKIVLLDWKSSNAVYGEHLCQLAAYKVLIEECENIAISGYYLCRFSKENADFAVHHFPNLDEAWRMFELLREAYEIDKVLKKRAA